MNKPAFKLSEQQVYAMEELGNFKDYYTLKGYAGTGKTTVITHWVQDMKTRDRKARICLTAPTNKATNVLKEKATELNLAVDTSTIHSLLALKMRWKDDQQILVPDEKNDPGFFDYDYVVIDECSMLGEELLGYVCRAQASCKNKVIFMGDPCQLPPVNEKDSRSFNPPRQTELTTILRQAKGNPIMDLSIYLRELIEIEFKYYPSKLFEFVDNKNILYRPLQNCREEILEAFAEAEENELDLRHVAWTNATVDEWNDIIRDRIYGQDREEWVKGERIVTTAPVFDPNEEGIIFQTDQLLTITHEPVEVVHYDVPCWELRIGFKKLYVVKKIAQAGWALEKQRLIKAAKADKKKWGEFYEFMESFAFVKPAYSMTVHRSQGSTFDDVYVSFENILRNPRHKEKLQCLYVAITRPRRRLILV